MATKATAASKPAAKAQFVRYLSNTHYASANLALYKNGDKFVVSFEVFGRAHNPAVRAAAKINSNLRTYLRGITFDSAEEAR